MPRTIQSVRAAGTTDEHAKARDHGNANTCKQAARECPQRHDRAAPTSRASDTSHLQRPLSHARPGAQGPRLLPPVRHHYRLMRLRRTLRQPRHPNKLTREGLQLPLRQHPCPRKQPNQRQSTRLLHPPIRIAHRHQHAETRRHHSPDHDHHPAKAVLPNPTPSRPRKTTLGLDGDPIDAGRQARTLPVKNTHETRPFPPPRPPVTATT